MLESLVEDTAREPDGSPALRVIGHLSEGDAEVALKRPVLAALDDCDAQPTLAVLRAIHAPPCPQPVEMQRW